MKFDMQSIMQQAQKMQQEAERIKLEASHKIVTAESGGGMIQVTMNGNNKVLGIKISKDAIDPNDIEMLEDLIVAAVNKATHDAQEMVSSDMSKLSSMIPNIPGLNFDL